MGLKAIIFDLDNTLYDETDFVKSGFGVVSEYISANFSVNEKYFYDALIGIFNESGREKVFDKASKELNIFSKELVNKLVEVYRGHFPRIQISERDSQVLLEIKRTFLVALLTNGLREVQENKVKALKLHEVFDKIIYAYDYGGKTTHAFSDLLNALKVVPSESMYVDDNVEGLRVAKSLGLATVRISRELHNCRMNSDEKLDSSYEIASLQELRAVILSIQKGDLK